MILAVDGGATKTEAIVFDNEVLGVGVAGSGNYHIAGVNSAAENTRHAVDQAFHMAGVTWDQVDNALYGFAGAESSITSRKTVEGFLASVHKHGMYSLFNDGVPAYFLSTLGRRGVVAVAGTGSVIQARDGEKRLRVGGWGWVMGDEGSAFYIGRRALQAATKSFDQRAPSTSLVNAIEKKMNLGFREAIAVFQENFSILQIASLAPIVTKEAGNGDEVAKAICVEAGHDLAQGVKAARERMGMKEDYIIGSVGGVFRGGGVVLDSFKNELKGLGGKFSNVYYGYHVVIGSLVMHLLENGNEVDETAISRLVSQLEGKMSQMKSSDREKYFFME